MQLPILIIFNSIIQIISIFICNYFVLGSISLKYPDIAILTLIFSIVSFILGFLISIYSSYTNCKKFKYRKAILESFRHIVYTLMAYYIIYFVKFVREPFIDLFGNDKFGFSIAISFLIVLNSTISVIVNYFSSIKNACKVSNEKLEKNLKKLDKYLNKKPIKKRKKKIKIKD